MKLSRFFDVVFVILILVFLAWLYLIIYILIRMTSTGPALYWSDRVGKDNVLFKMPKFRTMQVNTPAVATHLLENPAQYLTPIGAFLRKNSFDELPQLWSILKGDMSFVGPRPALFNQNDLIQLRTAAGVHALVPGLTGWAQINGRDDLSIAEKVVFDIYYLNHKSIVFDMMILSKTLLKVLYSDNIKH